MRGEYKNIRWNALLFPCSLMLSIRRVKKRWFFLGSLALTMAVMLLTLYLERDGGPRSREPNIKQLEEGLYLTPQLFPRQIASLRDLGVKTIIDMRPDGEAFSQPSSVVMQSAAHSLKLDFHYIPVPHESIPPEAVEALDKALPPDAMPACLYCRTGRRAARLYALVQASRAHGPNATAILKMVSDAGFSADDLKEEIGQRIDHRTSPSTAARP